MTSPNPAGYTPSPRLAPYRQRVIDAVSCGFCGAQPGQKCTNPSKNREALVPVPYVHDDRSLAYAEPVPTTATGDWAEPTTGLPACGAETLWPGQRCKSAPGHPGSHTPGANRRPYTPVRGYVRDFDPARDIDLHPYDPRPGSRLVIVDALFADQSRGHGVTRWVPLDRPRNCRMRVDREGKRRACGEPAVVAMMRPHGLHHEVPWGYCAKHVGVFLARWEGGRVLRAQTIDAEVSG